MVRNLPTQQDKKAFADLFDAHLKRGQRPDGQGQHWSNPGFAAHLTACGTQASEASVRNWRDGSHPRRPQPGVIEPILNAFFGSNPQFAGLRAELHDAWLKAMALMPRDPDEDSAATDEWHIDPPTEPLPRLVELRLHKPRPANRPESASYLDATLVLGRIERDSGNRTYSIGLKQASLTFASQSHEVVKDTMIGGTGRDALHVRRAPNGVNVVGPLSDDALGYIEGEPLNGEHVALIQHNGRADQAVSLSLHAGRRGFKVIDPDAGADAPQAVKDLILNILMSEALGADKDGRVLLARATMTRKPSL